MTTYLHTLGQKHFFSKKAYTGRKTYFFILNFYNFFIISLYIRKEKI